jgi:hypothetical protein
MKAIDLIRSALQFSDQVSTALVEDMRDASLTQPTPRGGNHPLWVAGHLAHTEGMLFHFILGEPNPVGHWTELFAAGAEPTPDAGRYPTLDEVLGKYRELRARNLRLLESVGEAGLDRPPQAPPTGMGDAFATIGRTFLTLAMHQMSHAGQVADARRAAGRKPLFGRPGQAAV